MIVQAEFIKPCSEHSPDLAPAYHLDLSPPHQSPPIAAIAALLVALVSISLSAILVRFSEHELSPYATAFNRFWITALVLAAWNGVQLSRRQWFPGNPVRSPAIGSRLIPAYPTATQTGALQSSPYDSCVVWQLLVAGAFLAADLIIWAWSLTQTSVANATLLANLTPLFTCLAAWLIWRRRFDKQLLLGMAIALGGTLVIGLSDLHVSVSKLQGDGTALLAALFFGLYLLILEQLQTRLSPMVIILGSSAIAALLTFPLVLLTHNQVFPTSWQGWLAVLSLALICQVIGQGLLVYSLSHLSSEFVAIFLLLDPILAALGGWVLFSETLGMTALMAFAIVLVGIYIAASSQSAIKETVAIDLLTSQYP
jgi:drug/metabolite transporter (DMT)-like permease